MSEQDPSIRLNPNLTDPADCPLSIRQYGDYLELDVRGDPDNIGRERFVLGRAFNYSYVLSDLLGLLEYSGEFDGENWRFEVPTTERLNAIRQKKFAGTNAHTAEFVTHDGGKMDSATYLTYFVDRQIPVAADPEYLHHDYFHALGFATLSEEVMRLMEAACRRALNRSDRGEMGDLTAEIDGLSGRAAEHPGHIYYIPREFRKGSLLAFFRKEGIEKRQNELASEIRLMARIQADLLSEPL